MCARNIVEKVKDTKDLNKVGQLKLFDLSRSFSLTSTTPVKGASNDGKRVQIYFQ